MPFVENFLRFLLLAAPPLVTWFGIQRTRAFWPLIFFTFIGSTITIINFRVAAQLADLVNESTSSQTLLSGSLLRLFSWLGLILLSVGLWKIRVLRRKNAIERLLQEEAPEQ